MRGCAAGWSGTAVTAVTVDGQASGDGDNWEHRENGLQEHDLTWGQHERQAIVGDRQVIGAPLGRLYGDRRTATDLGIVIRDRENLAEQAFPRAGEGWASSRACLLACLQICKQEKVVSASRLASGNLFVTLAGMLSETLPNSMLGNKLGACWDNC